MKIVAGLVGALISIVACFALGYSWRDLQDGKLPDSETLASAVSGKKGPATPVSARQIFKDAYGRISKGYYKPVDAKELKYAGMQGLLASLGDPHTLFLEPTMAREFALETGGNFVGIGARLSRHALGATIVIVFDNGPANRAGIKKGDLITAVDGKPSAGKKVEDLVKIIRGKEGTRVRLTLVRKDKPKPFDITVKRAQLVTPTVDADMVPGTRIGYVGVSAFAQPTTDQFDSALSKLQKQGMRGLILDVRGNGGGLLETAVEMLSRFVEDKVVVKMRMRDGREEAARTFFGYKRNLNFPIIVLINRDSASASEIFAGVLSDYKIATLVGEHSYGKASVQNVYGLVDGSSAKVTIARYFIPSGRDISRKVDEDGIFISGGLQPDEVVKYKPITPAKGQEESVVPSDSQIKRAVELIRAKTG